jgi:hypothetical protein
MTKTLRAIPLTMLMLAAPAFTADTGDDMWTFTGDRFGDLRGPVLPTGSWLLRSTLGHADFKDGTSERVIIPELVVGLPYRLELRLLDEFVSLSGESGTEAGGEAVGVVVPEIRWAFAAPGAMRFNPALGFAKEFISGDADIWRASLYLSDTVGDRSFWGSSFTYQKRSGGDHELELIGKLGWHYMLQPQRFSLGMEAKYEHAKTSGIDAGTTQELLLGPSAIWKIGEHFRLRGVAEFGTTSGSPNNEIAVSFEWQR